jgi:16S rRNA C967 or C1407 C5-methylase (RsmB/RsmF family)/NOL1/NOP2/fmu family ribosome biogenesis protein
MPNLPAPFLEQMNAQLGAELPDFLRALDKNPPISVRFHPQKWKNLTETPFPNLPFDAVPWHTEGVYLYGDRPIFTLDPSFHAGAYYVQEASSMFIAAALKQVVDVSKNLTGLDLCAAPGGKTTLLASLVSPDSLVVTNEVIRNRVEILKENIGRWGLPNVYVSNHDSEDFKDLTGFFDVVLVDAPCSGEGLFRKDPNAVLEWSESAVQTCSARQKRILANAAQLVKPNGILLYSTCTYNAFENLINVENLVQNFDFQSIRLEASNGIVEKNSFLPDTTQPCFGYQFYPHRLEGEGFFLSVLRKKDFSTKTTEGGKKAIFKHLALPKKQVDIAANWLETPDDFAFFQKPNGRVFIVLKTHLERLTVIDKALQRKSVGLEIGEFKGSDFIPSHEFALSTPLSKKLPSVDLDRTTALRFLKKMPIEVPNNAKNGWALAKHNGLPLGWLKILPNRVNNYLPKEFRIRMEIPS